MACRESKGGVVLVCLGLLLFVVSLCNCSKPTKLNALNKSRETSVHTKSQTERAHLHNGRLLIGQSSFSHAKLNATNSRKPVLDVETDYQSDMGWQTKQSPERSDWQKMAMENLLKMESKVECSQDSMKLLVHDATSTPESLILVDRGNLSPLSLTKLPSSCGYTIRSTQKDLVLQAPYDGCFVIIQENYYVLPLIWLGLPVRMSCPLMGKGSQNPPMVTCHAEGMVVKTEWTTAASKIKVNVNGNWESLLTAAHRCAFGIVEHPEGVVISVHYAPCLVKKDGMYTIELAANAETKVSCPSLSAAQLKLSGNQVRGSVHEREILGEWMHPFPTQNPLMLPTRTADSQAYDYSQNLQIPGGTNQGSNPGYFPYYNFPGFPYVYLKNPETTPTKQPQSPTTLKKVKQSTDHSIVGQFYPQLPTMPEMRPPVTKFPPSNLDQYPNKHVFPLDPQRPEQPSSFSKVQGQNIHSFYYTDALSQLSNSYPLYLEKLPEEPGKSPPTSQKEQGEQMPVHLICTQEMVASQPSGPSWLSWLGMFQGNLNQRLQLVCTQMEPVSKPADFFHSSHPEAPNRQVNELFNLLCTLQGSKLQHLKTSQGQMYYSFYLFCNQQKQASKPAEFTRAQPETTKGHLYQAFHPLYFQSPQTPSGVTQPPQAVTQAQQYSYLYPFYPKPNQKPAVNQPPQPGTPRAQIYQGSFPFFPQQKPTHKPAVTPPPQPAATQALVEGSFPFFPQPKPNQKPAATWPSQPANPQALLYSHLFPFYPQSKPTQKPAVTGQPQQATSQPQVYPPFFYFYTKTNAAQQPAVTQMPQSATSQSKVYQHFFDLYPKPKPATNPTTVAQPQQLELLKGQVSQPLYHYHQKTQPKPTSSPIAEDESLQPEKPIGQEQQKCLYSQLWAENQLANTPTKPTQGLVYGPCQSRLPVLEMSEGASVGNLLQFSEQPIASLPQAQHEYLFNFFHSQQPLSAQQSYATSMQKLAALASEQKLDTLGTKHGNRVFCPNFCPSELSNCCLQIALHQHLHISAPFEVKPEPQTYKSFSPASYFGVGQGLETAEVPQKLSSAAVQQAAETSASAQISPQSQTPSANRDSFRPQDSGATFSRGSLGMIANREQFYPYFGTELQNPYLPHVGQNGLQPSLEQFKTEYPDDPSKLWALGNEQSKPVVEYEPFNIGFAEQMLQSRPDLMSYLGHHVLQVEQQSKPPDEQKSLHKSEYKRSTHNFKRAIDRFFSHYMPGDSPASDTSLGFNVSQEMLSGMSLKNLTKTHKPQNLFSEPQSFVLLQDGPPGREPHRLRDSKGSFGDLAYGANSKAFELLRNADPHTLESLQAKTQKLERLWEGTSSLPPGNVNHMRRGDDASSSFNLMEDDSNPLDVYPEQSFSAEQLKPEILKSFENLWKYPTPSDFSQLFVANVPGKAEEKGSDQLAQGIEKPVMAKKNPKDPSVL